MDTTRLAADWTALWNGELALAGKIVAPRFRIRFGGLAAAGPGDAVTDPAALAGFIAAFRAERPGLRYALDGRPAQAADPDRGTGTVLTLRWYAQRPDAPSRSGIDWLRVHSGQITDVWSVTGERRFPT
jgi:hypothetical protein